MAAWPESRGDRGVRLALAWRLAWRECVAGELNVLALALIVAVCAMSSVGFFAERVERGLALRVSQLLAADLVLNADAPVPAALRQEALGRSLVVSESTTFPSMIMAHDQAQLVSFKAVDAQYPLRGQMTVRLLNGQVVQGATRPAPGCAWADPRLMARLGLRLGDSFAAGNTHLRLTGEVVREPDGALDFYSFIPRLMLNRADLPATGLVQTGTRARWRLMVAGEPAAVTSYGAWLAARMPRGRALKMPKKRAPKCATA